MDFKKQAFLLSFLQDPMLNDAIAYDLISFVERLTPGQRRILNCFLYWHGKTGMLYMRQDTVARYAGFSREHTNRFIGQMQEWGIISKAYRHMKSCLYKVSPVFNDLGVRAQLRHLLSSLVYFPIALLTPDITQYISSFIYKTFSTKVDIDYKDTRASEKEKTMQNGSLRSKWHGKKSGECMSEVPAYVKLIKNPSLSHADQLSLAKFSQKAVEFALRCVMKKGDLQSPVGYMVACCRKYEEEHKNNTTSLGSTEKKQEKPVARTEKRTDSEMHMERLKQAHMSESEIAAHHEYARQRAGIMADTLIQLFNDMIAGSRKYHETARCHLCPGYTQSSLAVPQPQKEEGFGDSQFTHQKSTEIKKVSQREVFSDILNLEQPRRNLTPKTTHGDTIRSMFARDPGAYDDARWRIETGGDEDGDG